MSFNHIGSSAPSLYDSPQRLTWQTILSVILLVWLSSSLLLDALIMPTLYAAGMMTSPGFATAGYSLFWLFNRLELVCGAVVLTGALAMGQQLALPKLRWGIALATGLLAIALFYTYGLTPTMSALGLHLNLFESLEIFPTAMNTLHGEYFGLELVKLAIAGTLLWLYSSTPQKGLN
ncbi:MAG: hypothetical protein VKK04_04570 [Synechococcales bacterium]|nr:hypothetical protein [Synechococcales bacterium]